MTAASRVEWVDIVKSFAIILVAIYHTAIIGIPLGLIDPVWSGISNKLEAFRMPVFFFAAGLFAESVIKRPWTKIWSTRLALLVWAFLVWTCLRYVYFLTVPMETRPHETSLTLLMLAPVWPSTGLWFLHALGLFFVITKVLLRVPLAVKLCVALVLSLVFFTLTSGNLSYDGMGRYYLFFLAGAYFREVTLELNAVPRWRVAAVSVVLFATVVQVLSSTGLLWMTGARTVLGIFAILTGCLVARVLEETPLKRLFIFVGKNTLPIYVLHIIVIAALLTWLDTVQPDGVPRVAALTLPVLGALVVVPLALVVATLSAKTGPLRYLFEAPDWFANLRPRALGKQESNGAPELTR